MNLLDNLMTEIGQPMEELARGPGDAAKDPQTRDLDPGSHGMGFFISPLRQTRSRAELERIWKDAE